MRALHFGIFLGLITTWTSTALAGEIADQVRLLGADVPVVVCARSTSKFEDVTIQLNSKIANLADATAMDRLNKKHLTVSAPSLSDTPADFAACVTVSMVAN